MWMLIIIIKKKLDRSIENLRKISRRWRFAKVTEFLQDKMKSKFQNAYAIGCNIGPSYLVQFLYPSFSWSCVFVFAYYRCNIIRMTL